MCVCVYLTSLEKQASRKGGAGRGGDFARRQGMLARRQIRIAALALH